jgi:hypothetical protein
MDSSRHPANNCRSQRTTTPSNAEKVLDCSDNPYLAFHAFYNWCYHATYTVPDEQISAYSFHREVYKVALRYGAPELVDL